MWGLACRFSCLTGRHIFASKFPLLKHQLFIVPSGEHHSPGSCSFGFTQVWTTTFSFSVPLYSHLSVAGPLSIFLYHRQALIACVCRLLLCSTTIMVLARSI